ncbi:MAG: hypothetical protein AABY95_07930 [Pseudomonadota bacterium]
MSDSAPTPRAAKVIVPLALLFFVPLLAAYTIFFYFPEWIPEGKTNYGTLVSPARPATGFADALKGRWTYVYLADDGCTERCLEKLVQIRQIRLALNEKRQRVQRVLLVSRTDEALRLAEALKAEHPDLRVLADSDGKAREFFAPADADALYLLDPLGNWLMTYPAAAESRGLFKDIKKLLRLSQIG